MKQFPVWGIRDGKCACGNAKCASAGKHPVAHLAPHGVLSAREGWVENGYNVGIATGDGLVVLDIDPRNGGRVPDGIPPTYTVATGGGGLHLYYTGDRPCGTAGPGLDIKGRGGYVVGPGSTHISGGVYKVIDDRPMAPWPNIGATVTSSAPPAWDGKADARDTPLGKAFEAKGWLGNRTYDGGRMVRCPWLDSHSDGRGDGKDSSTVVFHNGVFHCSHGHCLGLHTQGDVRKELGMTKLNTDKDGKPLKTAENDIAAASVHDELWYDEMRGCPMWDDEPLENHHALKECARWSKELKYERGKYLVYDALEYVARTRPVHKLRQYLDSIVWDGVPRVDTWLEDYCNADSPMARAAGRCFFISAVARAFEPGCKVDTMLMLYGKTGGKKSMAFSILGGEWFKDTPAVGLKAFYEVMRGTWIYEVAEGAGFKGLGDASRKALISSGCDSYRASYARSVSETKRTCVMVCTTNEVVSLTDVTGDRRYHVVEVGALSEDALRRDRDQLWAEAVVRYRAGEKWWLDEVEEVVRETVNSEYRVEDILMSHVEDICGKFEKPFQSHELHRCLVNCGAVSSGMYLDKHIARCLRTLGYERVTMRSGDKRTTFWRAKTL